MTAWIESLNSQSADWAAWLWRITWQSALVIAVAFALTLLLRRYSPRLRSWIWRLAYLKLLVLMVWTTPVQLAVLPSAEPLSGRANGPSIVTASEVENREPLAITNDHKAATADRAEPQTDPTDRSRLSETNATPAAPINESPAVASPPVAEAATQQPKPATTAAIAAKTTAAPIAQPSKPSASLSWKSYLLLTWLAGIVLVVAWLGWEIARAARLRRSVRVLNQPELQTLLADVCQHLGLRSTVRIGESDLVGGPMLVRFIRPAIVFPSGLLPLPLGEGRGEGAALRPPTSDLRPPTSDLATTLTPDEIRLVLAHELAHLKRHDLTWNALAAIVHVLLYFHPLVWLAHRRARQEQEMACDEMVVTHLGAARHDYGQMLVKVVRRLGRNFPTGMAVVGMASSYQTLSQRIEAMKFIRPITRRQIALAACGLALLGVLTIIPWQVVAQEKKRPTKPPASPAVEKQIDNNSKQTPPTGFAAAATPGDTANDDPAAQAAAAALKKKLLGRWRDFAGKEIEFFKDGTYEDLGVKVMRYVGSEKQADGAFHQATRHDRGGGQWTADAPNWLRINFDKGVAWDSKFAANDLSSDGPLQFFNGNSTQILRLDDSFLRLKFPSTDETLFFRRVDDKSEEEKLADVPAALRPFFAAARLTPEEAIELWPLLQAEKLDNGPLQTLAQVWDAYRHKISMKQLFGLTPEEVTAFKELLQQSNDQRYNLFKLADADQLEPEEKSAVAKIKSIDAGFDAIADPTKLTSYNEVENAVNGMPKLVRRLAPQRPSQQIIHRDGTVATKADEKVIIKLLRFVEELDEWFQQAVFDLQ